MPKTRTSSRGCAGLVDDVEADGDVVERAGLFDQRRRVSQADAGAVGLTVVAVIHGYTRYDHRTPHAASFDGTADDENQVVARRWAGQDWQM